jgi:serpin B
MVLANAIYFKGRWQAQFRKEATTLQKFHCSAGHDTDVQLMSQLAPVRYIENDSFQAAELPYSGGSFAMVILLPRQITGCSALESNLSPAFLAQELGDMKETDVVLFIPRFKAEIGVPLASTLKSLGMVDAFDGNRADFSGMDGMNDLCISSVLHKAWIEVNEEGTEAAAVTAAPLTVGIKQPPPPPPPVFRADHPFIYLIRDTRLGSILFFGRLSKP